MSELKTNLVILALLALVLILAALVVIASEVLHPTAKEGSFIDKYIIPHTEEQVSIQEEEVEEVYTQTISRGEIVIVHDNKRNVTCWCYRGGQRGGRSCIPDHMLSP